MLEDASTYQVHEKGSGFNGAAMVRLWTKLGQTDEAETTRIVHRWDNGYEEYIKRRSNPTN